MNRVFFPNRISLLFKETQGLSGAARRSLEC